MVFTSPKSDKMFMFVQYILTQDKCKYKARKLSKVRDLIMEVESLYQTSRGPDRDSVPAQSILHNPNSFHFIHCSRVIGFINCCC